MPLPEPAPAAAESVERETGIPFFEIAAGVILVGMALAAVATRAFSPLIHPAAAPSWIRLIERPAVLWGSMGMLLLSVRTVLWLRYRPAPPAAVDEAPRLTVVIPAYNEGAMVEKSIESVVAARYPRERLEVLVVDDGSRDDTWLYVQRAAARHPALVNAIRFERNRGKRAALAEGFRRAQGDIVVTIDSDSVIDPGALLALAGPFRSPRVGAVAGRVEVYNRRAGLLGPMLQVRYLLSFDFLRAVQSTFGTVYCCPGALTAYRVSVVRRVLESWENQTFLGARCTYGEDRAMTNFILADGSDSVYQSNAIVHTIVPTTYRKLCKMFLRWNRSFVREEARFVGKVLWKRPPAVRAIAFVDSLITDLRYPVGYATIVLFVVLSLYDPMTILRVLTTIGLLSVAYNLYYLRSERSWCFLYGVLYSYFSFFALFWIFPWAALTVRSRSWHTR